MVESLIAERERQLRSLDHYPTSFALNLHGGRLLACEPLGTLTCWGSKQESNGYINEYDIPPCDTWIHYAQNQRMPRDYFHNYIICWVPEEFVSLVEAGREASCGYGMTLEWLKDLDTPLPQQLRFAV